MLPLSGKSCSPCVKKGQKKKVFVNSCNTHQIDPFRLTMLFQTVFYEERQQGKEQISSKSKAELYKTQKQ